MKKKSKARVTRAAKTEGKGRLQRWLVVNDGIEIDLVSGPFFYKHIDDDDPALNKAEAKLANKLREEETMHLLHVGVGKPFFTNYSGGYVEDLMEDLMEEEA